MKPLRKLTPANRCQSCDAALDTKRKYCDERCSQIELCKSKGTTKYRNACVAPVFQRMIRAEAGAQPAGYTTCVESGEIFGKYRYVGQCVCVTCGKVDSWDSGIKGIHTGHFLGSRCASILLEEANVAPQCSSCNFYRSGSPSEFRMWMEETRGIETIERLQKLKATSVSFTRDDLVDKRIAFSKRLKAAELTMKGM